MFRSLFQEADRQAASKGEERKSSDLQSKLMKAAMEENHSESAGSSVTSWDVDLSRGGSAEFRRGIVFGILAITCYYIFG
jgi:hypothetical protein